MQGDVVGVGYRPRTGTIFFTRNGKKLDDIAHGLKTQNFFPTVGANGPCTIHVNFGQSGFVFIEANVKKWGLAPMTGSLAPPPPYGSEQGSILLESGRDSGNMNRNTCVGSEGAMQRGGEYRIRPPPSPGPIRSPTEISLAQLAHVPSNQDVGEGNSRHTEIMGGNPSQVYTVQQGGQFDSPIYSAPPPAYRSPSGSDTADENSNPNLRHEGHQPNQTSSPRLSIPSYEAAMGNES